MRPIGNKQNHKLDLCIFGNSSLKCCMESAHNSYVWKVMLHCNWLATCHAEYLDETEENKDLFKIGKTVPWSKITFAKLKRTLLCFCYWILTSVLFNTCSMVHSYYASDYYNASCQWETNQIIFVSQQLCKCQFPVSITCKG